MFFDDGNFKALNYGFTPTDGQSNSFFVYAPPQAKAVKVFYANNPVKAQSLTINNNYAYTVTNTTDKIILNILNFTDQPIKLKLNDLVGFNSSKKTTVNQYMFNDLNSKQWDYVNNYTSSIINIGTVDLKKNSYSVVTIQK